MLKVVFINIFFVFTFLLLSNPSTVFARCDLVTAFSLDKGSPQEITTRFRLEGTVSNCDNAGTGGGGGGLNLIGVLTSTSDPNVPALPPGASNHQETLKALSTDAAGNFTASDISFRYTGSWNLHLKFGGGPGGFIPGQSGVTYPVSMTISGSSTTIACGAVAPPNATNCACPGKPNAVRGDTIGQSASEWYCIAQDYNTSCKKDSEVTEKCDDIKTDYPTITAATSCSNLQAEPGHLCTGTDVKYCKDNAGAVQCASRTPGKGLGVKADSRCDKNVANSGVGTAIGCIPSEPSLFIAAVLRIVTGAGGGIALLLMIFGAFQMITSSGSAEQLKAGREQFTSAVIGLLFVVFSVLLLEIIGVDLLAIPGFGTG